MVLVAMAKALAIFVGYTETKYDNDPLQIEDTTNSVDDLDNSLGGATASAKELKKVLMGFDVLNVITTPTESSGGGGAGSDLEIDPAILNALKEYDNLMEGIRMKATDIRDRLLEWLGFTWDLDEEGNIINLRLGDGYTNLEKIRDILIAIGVVFAGFTILKKIIKLVSFVKDLKLAISSISQALSTIGSSKAFSGIAKALSGLSSTVMIVVAAVGLLVGVFVDAYKNDEDFRKSVDDLVNSFKKLLDTIKPIVEKILPKIEKAFNTIKKILSPILDIIKEIIKLNLRVQIEGLGTALEVITKLLEGDLSGALESFKQGLSDVFTAWVDYFDSMKTNLSEWIKNGKEAWSGFFESLTNKLKENPLFNTIITKFTETFESVKTTISNKVTEIREKIQPIVDKVVEIKDKIIEIFTTLWNWAYKEVKNNFIDPALKIFNTLKDTATKIFDNVFSKAIENLQPIVNWITDNIVNPVISLFNGMSAGISNVFDSAISNIKRQINSFIDVINSVIRAVNRITGSNIGEVSKFYSSKGGSIAISSLISGGGRAFATGGFPEVGEMFIAREAGPELVGSIGNRTAVVNNQQIVESVSRGVAEAVSRVMGTQGGNYNFYLDSEQMTAVVTKRQNRQLSVMGV